MSQDPETEFDLTVLEMIEASPIGAVPTTPTYQDALSRLYAARRIYADADHKNGHVTARALGALPLFHANNLDAFIAGEINDEALESNASIYERYVQSLPIDISARAEAQRVMVIGKPSHHRAKHGQDAVHDPMHTLFLVPGAGPHPGLPGNYLHGSLFHVGDESSGAWEIHVHDSDDGQSVFSTPALPDAMEKLQEVLASAPFHLDELEALGFRMV